MFDKIAKKGEWSDEYISGKTTEAIADGCFYGYQICAGVRKGN